MGVRRPPRRRGLARLRQGPHIVLELLRGWRSSPRSWPPSSSPNAYTAGEAALKKGYGKDPHVNGILASFWALAARQAWSPQFNRVSSAANNSDAVSRGDLRRARKMSWHQLQVPTDDVIAILARASNDLDYANSGAVVNDMLRMGDFMHF